MEIEECRARLALLRGQSVTSKQIVGNSLQFWLSVEARSDDAVGFWIDPPWRLVRDNAVQSTSADLAWGQNEGESDAEYQIREKISQEASNLIVGRAVETVTIQSTAHDLVLRFDDGTELQSFGVWREESAWNLRFYGENLRIRGWLDRITREPIDAPH